MKRVYETNQLELFGLRVTEAELHPGLVDDPFCGWCGHIHVALGCAEDACECKGVEIEYVRYRAAWCVCGHIRGSHEDVAPGDCMSQCATPGCDCGEFMNREDKCACGHVRDWHDGQGGCCMGCGPGECNSFREDDSPVYPSDEIKDDPEEVDLPQPDGPTIEEALQHALHHIEGAEQRWEPLQKNGATDAELTEAIGREFGEGGSLAHGGWRTKGGKNPEFSWPGIVKKPDSATLKGKRLLTQVREALEIAAPK